MFCGLVLYFSLFKFYLLFAGLMWVLVVRDLWMVFDCDCAFCGVYVCCLLLLLAGCLS